DGDGSPKGGVFVGAADRDWREQHQRVGFGQALGDGAGDGGVGGEGKVGAVLFHAAHRQDRDGRGAVLLVCGGGGGDRNTHAVTVPFAAAPGPREADPRW